MASPFIILKISNFVSIKTYDLRDNIHSKYCSGSVNSLQDKTYFTGYTGKLSAKYRKQTALRTDERVRLMDEIISGIQVIKMYAWEKSFSKIIRFARRSEIKIITKSSYVRAAFMAFNLFTTRCALFCTILTMGLSQQEITAAKVRTNQSALMKHFQEK